MTFNAIDYFATLGRKPGPFLCKSLRNVWREDDSLLRPTDIWNDAVTDIAIITEGFHAYTDLDEGEGVETFLTGDQLVDNTWSIISTSCEGHELEFPQVAIRRRNKSHRLDHITKIICLQPGEAIPHGFEVIKTSATGLESGMLKHIGFLAIKRADISSVMFIQGEPLIDEVCCAALAEGEGLPEHFLELQSSTPNRPSNSNGQLSYVLGIHYRSGLGLCDISYESATLDRYPLQDHSGLALPVNELPMFAFPNDLRLTFSSRNQFPLPVFFTFVFTDQNGEHLYAACLRFYEVVPAEDLEPVFREVYGDMHRLEILAGSEVFCPKVACVVSKRPFYRAMRRFLRQIYSLSLSSLSCPLEHFVAALVNQVPLPVEGGRPFHVMLDSALISPTSRPMAPIVFELPVSRFFPPMDLDFAGPLRCLSVDHMLAVFTLMLREAKLLFVCSSNTLLTEAMESFRMLLFPLSWASCFVSRLPDALGGMLQAPGGFMVGIHVMQSEDGQGFARSVHQVHNIVPGTYVVDLSADCLYQFDGRSTEQLSAPAVEQILKALPQGPKLRLKAKLQRVASEYRIGPQTAGLDVFDSAFDFQSQDDSQITAQQWEQFPTLELRDAFMVFMADLLGQYARYVVPPSEDLAAEDTYRTFKEEFRVVDYLDDAGDATMRSTLELLMETQMFAVLLQERSEGAHYSAVFFEQASSLLRQLGLSAGGHSSAHGQKSITMVAEMPAPLFELLEAENRWAALSKAKQQQLLHASSPSAQRGGAASPPAPHQLSMISLGTSSLSPLRGFSSSSTSTSSVPTARAIQTVHSDHLNDLLTMHRTMKSSDLSKQVFLSGGGTGSDSNQHLSMARMELGRDEDLQLHNPNLGPLVIPGPLLAPRDSRRADWGEQSTSSEGDDSSGATGAEERVTFTYQDGWPVFNAAIAEAAQLCIHPRLKEIRKDRMFAAEKIDKRVFMLIRSPAERLACEQTGCRVRLASAHEDVAAVVGAVLDLAATSITLLAARALQLHRPIADVLQMLGVVAQVDSWGLMHGLNECVWRSILISCAAGGGDFMRRIACVVFEGAHSVSGFTPDALTYGQYIQALAAKKASAATGMELDPFVYLEEMGHAWFLQRCLVLERSIADLEYSHSHGSSGTSSLSSSPAPSVMKNARGSYIIVTGKNGSKNSEGDSIRSHRLGVHNNASVALQIAEKFSLHQPMRGLLTFMRPNRAMYSQSDSTKTGPSLQLVEDVRVRLEEFAADAVASFAGTRKQVPTGVGRMRTDSAATDHSVSSTSGGSFTPDKFRSFSGAASATPLRMMSRLYGAAKSSAASVTASTGGTAQSVSPKPAESGWMSRRLGAAAGFYKSPSVSTPPPPPSSSSANVSQRVSAALQEENITLTVLSQTLNFDDEEEDDDSTSSAHSIEDIQKSAETHSESTEEVAVTEDGASNSTTEAVAELSLGSGAVSTDTTAVAESVKGDAVDAVDAGGESSSIKNSPAVTATTGCGDSGVKRVDSGLLQQRIEAALSADSVRRGQVTGIHSCSPCGQCGFCALEEEVMAVWCRRQSQGLHLSDRATASGKPGSVKMPSHCGDVSTGGPSSSNAPSKLTCSQCSAAFSPMLHVRSYRRDESGDVCVVWSEEVCHLSPFAVRYELEQLVLQTGEHAGHADWLHRHRPDVYWGLVWYSNRCGLPSGLIVNSSSTNSQSDSQSDSQGSTDSSVQHAGLYGSPVVVGWRESVVRAKTRNVLAGSQSGSGTAASVGGTFDLADVFPHCHETELAAMRSVAALRLDGSPAGMHSSILELSRCKGLFVRDSPPGSETSADMSTPGTVSPSTMESLWRARTLYVALLTLAYMFGKQDAGTATDGPGLTASTDILNRVTKESQFDKAFAGAVKWVLSRSDVAEIGTTESDLLSVTASKEVQVVRAGFGFHC